MLRPSAFQNNQNGSGLGASGADSSSKSILRPSSFQLAASKLQVNKNEAESTSNDSGTSSTTTETPTNEEKISSTTANKDDSNEADETVKTNPLNSSKTKSAGDEDNSKSDKESKSKDREATTSGISSSSAGLGSSGLFSPNTATAATTTTPNLFPAATRSSAIRNGSENKNIGFVFGQNIHERTMGASEISSTENSEDNKKEEDQAECSSSLFAAAVANSAAASSSSTSTASVAQSSSGDKENATSDSSRVEDLTKVAREYEESRVQKRKYDEVQTYTGEENETNVCDVNCKLFAFIASNWEERGPGGLRLNDQKTGSTWKSSRVVFRTSGNLRVLINTKVWSGMIVEKSGQKSLRLTAMDSNDGQVKIFLAMARPDDINNLYTALKKRIDLEKEKDAEEQPTAESKSDEANDVDDEEEEQEEKDEKSNEPSSKREKKD